MDRVTDNGQVIVIHGQDRFAADLRELGPAMDHYNRWVDMLHARDDALDSPGQGR